MAQHGKKYREKSKLIELGKAYLLPEAVALAKDSSTAKFDAALELHVKCDLDVRQADQMVRATVNLPHGTGKAKRVAAFVSDDKIKAAKDAGADIVGGEELIEKIIKGGATDFDVAVATPDMMRPLAKAGKILGTKGLMPSPKAGTVTMDPAKVIKDLKGGLTEFKTDEGAVIHMVVGRASFPVEKLQENAVVAVEAIKQAKPSGAKGVYVKSAYLATTMGPSVKLAW